MIEVVDFDRHWAFSTEATVQHALKIFDRRVKTDRQLE